MRNKRAGWLVAGLVAFALICSTGIGTAAYLWVNRDKTEPGPPIAKGTASSPASKLTGAKGRYGTVANTCAGLDSTSIKVVGVTETRDRGERPRTEAHQYYTELDCSLRFANARKSRQTIIASIRVYAMVFKGIKPDYADGASTKTVDLDAEQQAKRAYEGSYGPDPGYTPVSGLGVAAGYNATFHGGTPVGGLIQLYVLDSNLLLKVEVDAARDGDQYRIGDIEPTARSIAAQALQILRL